MSMVRWLLEEELDPVVVDIKQNNIPSDPSAIDMVMILNEVVDEGNPWNFELV